MAVRQPVPMDRRTHVLEALQRCFEEAKGFIDEPQTQERLCVGACSILSPAIKLELMETDVFGATVIRDILARYRWRERARAERLARKELHDTDDEDDYGPGGVRRAADASERLAGPIDTDRTWR